MQNLSPTLEQVEALTAEELKDIARMFDIEDGKITITKLEGGHINRTYKVIVENNDRKSYFILQWLNKEVFPNLENLMENTKNVSEYIKKQAINTGRDEKRTTVTLIKARENDLLLLGSFRMQGFINNTNSYTSTKDLDKEGKGRKEKLELLESAGLTIGEFLNLVDGFLVETLYEIIPRFHDTPNRIEIFEKSYKFPEKPERKEEIEEYMELVGSIKEELGQIMRKLQDKTIPLRVTHNDTKLSNILFCNQTGKGILIDLDTIMPGSLMYDFGEGIRMTISESEEDKPEDVKLDLERFRAFTKGFLRGIGNKIYKEEREMLVLGAIVMTAENGIRFSTDYLNGDKYFNIHYEKQNLERAKAQFELLKQMIERKEELKSIVEEEYKISIQGGNNE